MNVCKSILRKDTRVCTITYLKYYVTCHCHQSSKQCSQKITLSYPSHRSLGRYDTYNNTYHTSLHNNNVSHHSSHKFSRQFRCYTKNLPASWEDIGSQQVCCFGHTETLRNPRVNEVMLCM